MLAPEGPGLAWGGPALAAVSPYGRALRVHKTGAEVEIVPAGSPSDQADFS